MLFPQVSLEEWCERHPELEIQEIECPSCHAKIRSDRPFMSKNYIGITSAPCSCGSSRVGCESSITRTAPEYAKWEAVMGYL